VALPVQRDLPTDTITGGLPLGDLPLGRLQLGDLPIDLPVDLPVQRDLPQAPALPMAGDVFAPMSLDRFGGFGRRSNVPENLTEITTLIPVIPATGDMTAITTVIPVIPAVDGAAAPELDGSSLDSTRAALANLFSTHPIA
jgi:hypothetical protein